MTEPVPSPDAIAQVLEKLDRALDGRLHHTDAQIAKKQAARQRFEDDLRRCVAPPGRLRSDLAAEEDAIDRDIQTKLEASNQEWLAAIRHLDRLCQAIRTQQPLLSRLGGADINDDCPIPEALALGRVRLSHGPWQGVIPRLLPFPPPKGCWIDRGRPDVLSQVHQLVLRVLTALPVRSIRMVTCDPRQLGRSLQPFLPLLAGKYPFVDQCILTRADEITAALRRELEIVEEILQQRLGRTYPDWRAYNRVHPQSSLPFTLLLVFDVPDLLTPEAMWALERLIEHGPRCGLLPVMTGDIQAMTENRMRGLHDIVQTGMVEPDGLVGGWLNGLSLRHLRCEEEGEPWPDNSHLDELMDELGDYFRGAEHGTPVLTDLFLLETFWIGQAANGVIAHIGTQDDGQPMIFSLGGTGTAHHALVAGRTGAGKSNLVHVLIHSLCHHYPPEALRLYLLDYKQGVEFNAYADPPLPHADLVAVECHPEFGLVVLRHLLEQFERRNALFKQQGITDISQYRERTPGEMPRLVVIIDEFLGIFAGDAHHYGDIERTFSKLLRQGRAVGIHLILATQTLRGSDIIQQGAFVSQIGMRLCLSCSVEDSRIILGPGNEEGATLPGPPHAILNASQGERAANRRFAAPLADIDVRRQHLKVLADAAQGRPGVGTTRIFNGSVLPPFPDAATFAAPRLPGDPPILLLGEALAFERRPFQQTLKFEAGNNLLIAGYDQGLQASLLRAILLSLSGNGHLEHLLYVAPSGGDVFDPSTVPHLPITKHGRGWDGNLTSMPVPPPGRFLVLLIDGLEFATPLLQGAGAYGVPKPDSPAHGFRTFLQTGPGDRRLTIVTTRRLPQVKEVLGLFDLRIGFTLGEDDASLLTGTRRSALATPDRALFAHVTALTSSYFRPFDGSNQGGHP